MQFVDLKGKMYPISECENMSERIIRPAHILAGSVLLHTKGLNTFIFTITENFYSSDLSVNVEPGSARLVLDNFKLCDIEFSTITITDCYYPTRACLDIYLKQNFGI